MTAALVQAFLPAVSAAAEETVNELPAPAWVFGVVAFGLLVVLLLATLAFGKGRPHP